MPGQVSKSRGRSTRTFRRMRATVLAESDLCIVCGHSGADSVDHLVAKAVDPTLAEDIDNLAPAHNRPCPTCGQRCQNVKGTKPLAALRSSLKTSQAW